MSINEGISNLSESAERLRVGECVVDIPLREIMAPGARRAFRVTPKSMAVLLALVEQAGKVVSRDALLAQVWPDTLPTNDVITQAITQLRKAFAEQREQLRYIETIAKTGYRLVAPIQWLGNAPVAVGVEEQVAQAEVPPPATEAATAAILPQAQAPAKARSPSRIVLFSLLALLLVGMMAMAATWLLRSRPAPIATSTAAGALDKPYQLLTSTTGFEIAPTLSPDASQVAYVSLEDSKSLGARILVQTTDPSQPRALTHPMAGVWDGAPTWAPNGREIAFLRRTPGVRCQVMVVSSSGGGERELTGCDPSEVPSFDWSPDSSALVFSSPTAGSGPPGLRIFDLSSGKWRALAYGATARDVDYQPRYSPDGKWIAFIRNAPLGDLWRVPAQGGVAEPLTRQHTEFRGWSWAPDGKAIVFGSRIDVQTRLYHLDLASRQVQDLGIEDAQAPTIAAGAARLAFVQRKPRFGIYRLPLETGEEAGAGERLFPSVGRDTLPSVSPDGKQLLFTSDRSGGFGLWWAELARPDSLRLIDGVHPRSEYLPVWSRDSRRALVVGADSQGRPELIEIHPESGQVSRLKLPLATNVLLSAAYLPDPGQLLVVVGSGKDRQQLLLLSKSGAGWRTLAALDDVSAVKVDWGQQRLLFTRVGQNGLWQTDFKLSADSVQVVDGQYPVRGRYRTWTVTENGQIEYLEHLSECTVRFRHIGVGRSNPRPRCLEPHRRATVNGFSANARNRSIYLPLAVEDGANIAFMPLPPSGDNKPQ